MGLIDNMQPHIKDALLEIPVAHRQEVSDVLVLLFEFEEWRLSQDPVVDDTPANRANYVAFKMAQHLVTKILDAVRRSRSAAATASVEAELGV